MAESHEYEHPDEWRLKANQIEPPLGGGIPPHLKLRAERFRQGCEVCGDMDWKATASGAMACGHCGNVFDVPVIESREESR